MFIRAHAVLAVVLIAIASLALVGCGGSTDSKYVGQWELDKEAFKAAMEEQMKEEQGEDDNGMNAFAAGMMASMLEGISVDIDIKKDHTFSASMTMMGDTDSRDGTWKVEGDSIVMTVPDEEPGRMSLKDGKLHLEMADAKPGDPPMILKRKN